LILINLNAKDVVFSLVSKISTLAITRIVSSLGRSTSRGLKNSKKFKSQKTRMTRIEITSLNARKRKQKLEICTERRLDSKMATLSYNHNIICQTFVLKKNYLSLLISSQVIHNTKLLTNIFSRYSRKHSSNCFTTNI